MSFNASTYRAAELFIVSQNANNYGAEKAVVVHNGSTAFVTVYGITNTAGEDSITITAAYDSGTVNVQATANNSATHAVTVQYSLAA